MTPMDKREKFKKLAEARVNNTIKSIRSIGKLSNRTSYAYEERDIQKIFAALNKELEAARKRFSNDTSAGDDGFRLD